MAPELPESASQIVHRTTAVVCLRVQRPGEPALSEYITCNACGHHNSSERITCVNCGALLEAPVAADAAMKTQAISNIDALLAGDRSVHQDRRNHVVGGDPSEAVEEEVAAPTEAIDFSALLASGALDGLNPATEEPVQVADKTEAIDFSAMVSSGHMPPPADDKPAGYDPTAAMNFDDFKASIKNKPPEAAPAPAPPAAAQSMGHDPTEAMNYDDFKDSIKNKPPSPSAPAPAPAPVAAAPAPAPAPAPAAPAPPPPVSTGGGGGGGGEEKKSKTGLYIGIGVAAFFLLCCCPSSLGYFFKDTLMGLAGVSEVAEEATAEDGDEDSENGNAGGEITSESIKKAIEGEGGEIQGEPTESNAAGIKTITYAFLIDGTGGSAVFSDFGDEEMAKQAAAAAENATDDAKVRQNGTSFLVVTVAGKPELAQAILDASAAAE